MKKGMEKYTTCLAKCCSRNKRAQAMGKASSRVMTRVQIRSLRKGEEDEERRENKLKDENEVEEGKIQEDEAGS